MSFRGPRAGRKSSGTPVIRPVVNCHCYNGDCSQVALCPNTKDVLIFNTNGSEDFSRWDLVHTLGEHDQVVTCIDWAPKRNEILTCSADRNAYVWTWHQDQQAWKPVLVLVRLNRAALCCKWSPNEDKFAVGSGSRVVSVCFYSEDQNWWVSNLMKKRFRSSLVSVAWHPTNNAILACASTDGHVYVCSAYVRKVDSELPKPGPFGKPLFVYDCGSWVHDVAFSPGGNSIGWVGHDSTLHTIEYGQGPECVVSVPTAHLPFRSLMFLSEEKVVCAGWNYTPVVFTWSEGTGWAEQGPLEKARPKHKNIINDIMPYKGGKFSTSGIDGRIFVWRA